MADTEFGKIAEQRLYTWLNRPDEGYSMERSTVRVLYGVPKYL